MSEHLQEPDQKSASRPHPSRRVQLAEVAVFLFLIMPAMVLSSFGAPQMRLSFPTMASISGLQDLALLSLVLFFVWRNGESLASIGWGAGNAWRELLLGMGLFVPFFYGLGFLESVLRGAGLPAPQIPPAYLVPSGMAQRLLAVMFLAVVAVSEETIFRGYLLRRFIVLTGRPTVAVVLSAGIFSLGHGYQGVTGVVAVGAVGLLFGAIYLWRGSLVALVVMHFLQDFMGIVVVPYLSK